MKGSRKPLNPLIFGMRVSTLAGLYRLRLRDHLVSEVLAGGGIAIGVALVFGVLVANGSLFASAGEVLHAVDGTATVELSARSSAGFSEDLARRARGLAGVTDAASLLRESAVVQGPNGRRPVQLVGVDPELLALKGAATRNLGSGALLLARGLGLPSDVAAAIGAQTQRPVTVIIDGAAHGVDVRAVMGSGAIGALASAQVAVVLLARAQALADLPGRVTTVFIRTRPGMTRAVLGELRTLAAGRLDVLPADNELRLLRTATRPTSQSTDLFAAIAVMVGFLLALNAMLLTVPQRRRAIADMRVQGYDSRQVLLTVISQALALGVMASILGILAGAVLARTIFGAAPAYLVTAFPLSGHQAIRPTTVLVTFGCGVLAAALASISPLLDLRSSEPADAVMHSQGEPGQGISRRAALAAAAVGALTVGFVTALVLVAPTTSIAGGVLLALAVLCVIPLAFRIVTRSIRSFACRHHGGMLAVTVIELDATPTRSAALAGIAALAVYGLVALGGARADLLGGLDQAIAEEWGTSQVWITPNANNFDADTFRAGIATAALARAPGVASVSAHQGGFLDVGPDRLWIRAGPPAGANLILPSQLLEGNVARADALMRGSGWAAVSDGFAKERDLHPGDSFTLPTPAGEARLRVAAVTTNLGWPSGTITINTEDYRRYWQVADPTTLAVRLRPGVTPGEGKRGIERVLGFPPGLRVQTAAQRIEEVKRSTAQGLAILSQISILLLISSALALAAALSTAIHQRRSRLAALKAQGFDRLQLWRSLLLESVVIVGVGSVDGALLGLYGHALADRYLRLSSGFPAPFNVGAVGLGVTLVLIAGISLAVIALPGYSAAGVPTQASFQE